MSWVYVEPIIENRTRDRVQILSFAVDAQSLQVSIRYAEGHMEGADFVAVGEASEAIFSGAEVAAALSALANPALYQEMKSALYGLLAGRLGVAGALDSQEQPA